MNHKANLFLYKLKQFFCSHNWKPRQCGSIGRWECGAKFLGCEKCNSTKKI